MGDGIGTGIAQRCAGLFLGFHFGGTLGAQREVVRRPQVCGHPQLAVGESRDRLGGQVLCRAELTRPYR